MSTIITDCRLEGTFNTIYPSTSIAQVRAGEHAGGKGRPNMKQLVAEGLTGLFPPKSSCKAIFAIIRVLIGRHRELASH